MAKRKKTPKRLTKRERKALAGGPQVQERHVHCVACGAHLHGHQFTSTPSTARYVACQHGTKYGSCVGCVDATKAKLDEHDRNGTPVQSASAWH